MEDKGLQIENIKKEGENNDLFDMFYNYFQNKQLSEPEKLKIEQHIDQLKLQYENEQILFNHNEQIELYNLFDKIVASNSNEQIKILSEEELSTLVNIMNYTIQREIKESSNREKQLDKEQIIKKIKSIKDKLNGKIKEIYLGESDYIVIVIPYSHKNWNRTYFDNKEFKRISKVYNNVSQIESQLFENGVVYAYSLEGCKMGEIAQEIPNQIYQDFNNLMHKLENIKQYPNHKSKDEKRIEKQLVYEIINFQIEYKHKLDVLSYGAEDFRLLNIALHLEDFLNIIDDEKIWYLSIKSKAKEYLSMVKRVLQENAINYSLDDEFIQGYIDELEGLISTEGFFEHNYEDYVDNLKQKVDKYKLNLRNFAMIDNIEIIQQNTMYNAIHLRVGNAHINGNNSVCDILKKQGISFITIIPDGVNEK